MKYNSSLNTAISISELGEYGGVSQTNIEVPLSVPLVRYKQPIPAAEE